MLEALCTALETDNVQLLKMLLQLGKIAPDTPLVRRSYPTALHAACANGQVEMARLLLSSGADANQLDRNGVTPLMRAATIGSRDLVKLLLSHGADPKLVTHADGLTALHFALDGHGGQDLELVSALLESGSADVACDSLTAAWTSAEDRIAQLTAAALGVTTSQLERAASPGCRLAAEHVIQQVVLVKASEGRIDLLRAAADQAVSLNFVLDCGRPLKGVREGCPGIAIVCLVSSMFQPLLNS